MTGQTPVCFSRRSWPRRRFSRQRPSDGALSAAAAAAVAAGVPAETRRAYAGDWDRFTAWCAATGRTALPAGPETLTEYATYLTYECGRRPGTAEWGAGRDPHPASHRRRASPYPRLARCPNPAARRAAP